MLSNLLQHFNSKDFHKYKKMFFDNGYGYYDDDSSGGWFSTIFSIIISLLFIYCMYRCCC